MERASIRLPEWRWECTVFYDTSAEDLVEVLHALQNIGCSRMHFFRAKAALMSDRPDTGLTFTSFERRASVMVISRTTGPEQFQNTFDHEKGHLARHICLADGIDPYGEEAQYLAGDIGQRMFRTAKKYICEC